ncbi:hypothetical protein [Acidovorax sp. SDU_ACID1]|uniref:hypothetical protein n=1 Tax=Acidovorax sp. SDU_ACID1 TaxID=3136632 RepID=UPI003872B857
MPMELMVALARGKFPTAVDNPADVDKLRVLAAAGLVEAQLPDVESEAQCAQVFAITPEGKAALDKSMAKPG